MRVGILFNFAHWMGGVNYLYNLIYAINTLDIKDLKILLIVSHDISNSIIDRFEGLCEIKKDTMMDKWSLKWFLSKIERKLFNTDYLKAIYLRKYKLDILSHSDILGTNHSFKTVNWIPDFQHLHLSHLFSKDGIKYRNSLYKKIINDSNLVVVSSNDAFNDYKKFINNSQKLIDKARVLQFVTQVNIKNSHYSNDTIKDVLKKYVLKSKFFYLPNQFWDHKNHIVVLKAINLLKKKYPDIQIVCSGSIDNIKYYDTLINYIEKNNLKDYIKILKVIPYSDVMILFQASIAVINPSKFEGWSTTVEECKSFGKTIILSNIPVHLEQNPRKSYYFDSDNENELAKILVELYQREIEVEEDEFLIKNLEDRTNKFAQEYLDILNSVIKKRE